ncbi:hypothetical protein Agub_g10370 [Astrephomene gubernaculifera]|uniref:3,4-dihydroxy-2-butanone-4-phosphate synthase n=1 Tax=Astrephomene gubernaculifera TaxID=47775 RepID=A0AAD3DZC2_9CHLO|nr:hypothetical protein Agub_g10370 [Astrephomene gubernaculifera]
MLARLTPGTVIASPAHAAKPVPVVSPVHPATLRTVGALPLISSVQSSSGVVPKAKRCSVLVHGQANSSLQLPIDLDLEEPLPGFDSIASALADLAAGKLVVVVDDEDRENEGDLIMNADKVTTESMAFLVEYTSGVVCISMEGSDLDRLRLPLMVNSAENEESMYTAFTVTVDIRDGITTGISASDRTKTVRRLADPTATAGDFRRPGHIFPLRCRPGGVLVRPGHTEAGVDLARLSGSFPAGVLCELVNKEDGSMARTPQLLEFSKRHGLRCITIADLIRYRLRHDTLITPAGQPTPTVTRSGTAVTTHCFRSLVDGTEHVAFVHGAVADASSDVLLHVHHERTLADLLDCSEPGSSGNGSGSSSSSSSSLDASLRSVAQAGAGVVLYMRGQTARGIPPSAELLTLAQQQGGRSNSSRGQDLYATDLRDAALVAQMLRALGVSRVVLAGGDAALATALRSCGLSIRTAAAAAGAGASSAHYSSSSNGTAGHARGNQQPLQAAGAR